MLKLKRLGAAAVLVAVLAAAGCGRGSGKAAKSQVVNEDNAPLTMTVKVRGDLKIDFEGKVPAKYTAIRSTSQGTSVEVLGVRSSDAIQFEHGLFVPGMTVTPYRGDGTYVVPKSPSPGEGQQPKTPQAAGNTQSQVTLFWYSDGVLNNDPLDFTRYLEPCVIKIEKSGTRGHAKCPKMTNTLGTKTVSLEFKWKAPKFEVHDRVTIPDSTPDSSSTSSSMPDSSSTSSSTP